MSFIDHDWRDDIRELPMRRKMMFVLMISAGLAMLVSAFANLDEPIGTGIHLLWMVAMFAFAADQIAEYRARKRAEQNTLEGIEQ